MPDYLSVKEVAALLRVHHRTVRKWIRDGILPAVRVRRLVRIRRVDVDRLANGE